MAEMDFDKLFVVRGGFARGALHLDPVEPIEVDDAIDFALGNKRPPGPLRFRVQSGKGGDWVLTTMPPLRVISTAVVEVLEGGSFSGWSRFPVEIERRDGTGLEGYSGLAVTGRSGPVRADRRQDVIRPAVSDRGNPYRAKVGLSFEESSWDGSDLFVPEGSGYVIVTDAVRKRFLESDLSNVEFTPLPEVESLL